MLIRLPPTKPGDLDLELVEHIPGGQHAVGDVRAVQPMMRDWGLRVVDPRNAVHEGRGAKRRFARQAKIEERRVGLRKPVAVGAGKLHEQVVRVLPINQRSPPVRGFAGRKQQRVTVRTHQWVGRQHRAKAECSVVAERALRHSHDHTRREGLIAAARTALMVIDAEQVGVAHQHPLVAHEHHPLVRGAVGLPGSAGRFPRHRVWAELPLHAHAVHLVTAVFHAGHRWHPMLAMLDARRRTHPVLAMLHTGHLTNPVVAVLHAGHVVLRMYSVRGPMRSPMDYP